jgi:hypothetical protein
MKVFISHAYTDVKLARQAAEILRDAGFQVWDDSQILPGENWGEKLAQALHESEAMVILLTPDSVRSRNVTYELGYALGKEDYKGRVISVLAASPGELAQEDIPWVLRKFRMIRLQGDERDEEGLRSIAQALEGTALGACEYTDYDAQ